MTKADAKKAALEHRRRLLSCSTDLMAEIDALIADENTKDLVELPERQISEAPMGSRSWQGVGRTANHTHTVDDVTAVPPPAESISRPVVPVARARFAPHRRSDER